MSKGVISGRTFIQCPSCAQPARLGVDIDLEEVPAGESMQCPGCGASFSAVGVLNQPHPKLDPSKTARIDKRWSIYNVSAGAATVAAGTTGSDAPIPDKPNFWQRAEAVANKLTAVLDATDVLHASVAEFAQALHDDIIKEHQTAEWFLESWRPQHLLEFVRQPFTATDAGVAAEHWDVEDWNGKEICKYIFAPKFFAPHFGFNMITEFGFHLELVCPYSLMTFPLETWLHEAVGLPRLPSLTVHGSKIVGHDLPDVWESIPGTVEDVGHSESYPSIIINDPFSARSWLAKRAVLPWNASPVIDRDVLHNDCYHEIMNGMFGDAGKRAIGILVRYGRLYVAWQNIVSARAMVATVRGVLAGPKLCVVATDDAVTMYRAGYHLGPEMPGGSWTVVKYDHTEVNALLKSGGLHELYDYIVVDYEDGVPLSFLRKLYTCRSRVVVLGTDPIMDTLGANEEASTIYGLCGMVSTDCDEQHWRGASLPDDSRLRELFSALRKR